MRVSFYSGMAVAALLATESTSQATPSLHSDVNLGYAQLQGEEFDQLMTEEEQIALA